MGEVELFGKAPVIVAVLRDLSMSNAKRAKESGADMIELRIDLLKDEERSVAKIKEFVSMLRLTMPVIITNRRKEEGGSFSGTEEERIALLSSILETADVNAVDIEFFAPAASKTAVVERAKRLKIPVIFSYHDFKGMPGRAELLKIISGMYEEGGSVAKIAVTPQTFSDALQLLELTQELSREGKLLATIGMGPVGRHLRVIAPLYGSVLTYGFLEGDEEVAPGQFSVRELKLLLEKLGYASNNPLLE